jgi:hypothetical protein
MFLIEIIRCNMRSLVGWSHWRFQSGPELRDYIRDEVFPYMASLAKDEPEVADYFRDAVPETVDPNVLKQVIDELDAFEFRKLGPDVKGDIFEYPRCHYCLEFNWSGQAWGSIGERRRTSIHEDDLLNCCGISTTE